MGDLEQSGETSWAGEWHDPLMVERWAELTGLWSREGVGETRAQRAHRVGPGRGSSPRVHIGVQVELRGITYVARKCPDHTTGSDVPRVSFVITLAGFCLFC